MNYNLCRAGDFSRRNGATRNSPGERGGAATKQGLDASPPRAFSNQLSGVSLAFSSQRLPKVGRLVKWIGGDRPPI